MPAKRIIARLDVKRNTVVKGLQMDGLRVVGDPYEMATRYAEEGADELLYIDVVASLYQRCGLFDIVERASRDCFVPMIVGGGLRTLEDMRTALNCGADSLAINTAAIERPEFISEAARKYGSQAITVSIEAKRMPDGSYQAYTDSGREPSGKEVGVWARQAEELGAGQILVTSIDRDGTAGGLDLVLLRTVTEAVSVSVIASGGATGSPCDAAAFHEASGIAIGAALHSRKTTIAKVKETMMRAGLEVRPVTERAA